DQQTSSIGIPGGDSRLVEEADLTWEWMRYKIYRLRWQSTVGEGDCRRHILVFNPQRSSWPGSQPVVVVYTDAAFRVLAWRGQGGEPRCLESELKPEGDIHRLLMRFRLRGVSRQHGTSDFLLRGDEMVLDRGMPPLGSMY